MASHDVGVARLPMVMREEGEMLAANAGLVLEGDN